MNLNNTTEQNNSQELVTSAKKVRRNIVGAATGTALEYFDFALYGLASALVFNQLFFPSLSTAAGFLASFATFGVGFFARAAGGFVLGYLGDRIGRKKVLLFTIGLMGVATAAIGILPTYSQIGIFAPILLVVLRLLQGFGAGAEIAGASTLLVEVAPKKSRGFVTSFVSYGINIGTIAASGVWLLVATLPEEALLSWGWRIPFIASILLLIYTLYMRKVMDESPNYEAAEKEQIKRTPKETYSELFQHGRKAFLRSVGMRIGESGSSTFYQVYLVGVITTVVGTKTTATSVMMWTSIIALALIPIFGYLSDKFGRRKMLICISIFQILWLYPSWILIQTGHYWSIFVSVLGGLVFGVIASNVIQLSALPEQFGSRHRYSGLAVSKEIGGMISGGLVPMISAAISTITQSALPILLYIGLLISCTLVSAILSPETRERDLFTSKDA